MTQEQALNIIKQYLEVATRHGAYGLQDTVNIIEALKVIDPSIVKQEEKPAVKNESKK